MEYAAVLVWTLVKFLQQYHEAIIAAGTIALGFFTLLLWRSGVWSAKRGLCAYVGVEAISIANIIADQKPTIQIKIKNFGKTPAYRLIYDFDMVIEKKFKWKLSYKRNWSGRNILNPSDTFTIHSTKNDPLSAAEVADLQADTQRIFLFGVIKYRDAFHRARKTRVRNECGGAQLIGIGRMQVSKKGNSAN
jgi:hypothetical protein